MEPNQTDHSFGEPDVDNLTPGQVQVREWQRPPPAQPIRIVQEALGSDFVMALPVLHGQHAVVKVVPTAGCDLSRHEQGTRCRLDEIGWEWITLKLNESGNVIRFGMAPIRPRHPTIAYHTTLKTAIPAILEKGLLPSTSAIRQTRFPDTEGRIHATELLNGDGSAVRWIKIFSKEYGWPQSDYGILEVNLRGIGGRIYQDAHSQYGLVIERLDRIPPDCIRVLDESAYEREDDGKSVTPNPEKG